MEPDFGAFLKTAYLEPLPKRLIAAGLCVLLAICWGRLKNFFPKFNALAVLGMLFIAGLALRTGWVLLAPTHFCDSYEDKTTDQSESSLIQIYSGQIAQTGIPTYPEGTLALRRPVGYLYMLGGIYRAFGNHQIYFKILQILMGALLVPLAYFLAMQFFRNQGIALLASALMAVYPLNILSANILLDEFPFFLFSFAALCLAAKNIQTKTVKHTLAIGVLCGLAAASRTHALMFPIIFSIAYVFCRLPIKQSVIHAVLGTALVFVVNSPWAVITNHHYGKPKFFTSLQTGFFYCALNDKASWHNGYYPLSKEDGGDPGVYAEANPVKAAERANVLSVQWLIENPVKILKMGIKRNMVLFGFQLDDNIIDLNHNHAVTKDSAAVRYIHPLRKLLAWAYGTLALLALGGMAVLLFNRREFFLKHYPAFLLVLFMLIYWFMLHSLIFGFRKYRWFADLMMIFPASFFLHWISSKFSRPAPK